MHIPAQTDRRSYPAAPEHNINSPSWEEFGCDAHLEKQPATIWRTAGSVPSDRKHRSDGTSKSTAQRQAHPLPLLLQPRAVKQSVNLFFWSTPAIGSRSLCVFDSRIPGAPTYSLFTRTGLSVGGSHHRTAPHPGHTQSTEETAGMELAVN